MYDGLNKNKKLEYKAVSITWIFLVVGKRTREVKEMRTFFLAILTLLNSFNKYNDRTLKCK